MIIRAYDPSEAANVRDLLTRAFGQTDEATLVDALRATESMALELVAEHKKKIVGHVGLSRMVSPEGWLALAPVCTEPKMQKRGIGSALCQMAMQYANAPVVVLGEPAFYGSLGFEFDRCKRLTTPFPVKFTGLFAPELNETHPIAMLEYAAAFAE